MDGSPMPLYIHVSDYCSQRRRQQTRTFAWDRGSPWRARAWRGGRGATLRAAGRAEQGTAAGARCMYPRARDGKPCCELRIPASCRPTTDPQTLRSVVLVVLVLLMLLLLLLQEATQAADMGAKDADRPHGITACRRWLKGTQNGGCNGKRRWAQGAVSLAGAAPTVSSICAKRV